MGCPDEVVKCACGLPMRQRDWADHWRTCRYGSPVPVTDDDVMALEASEARRSAWLASAEWCTQAPISEVLK